MKEIHLKGLRALTLLQEQAYSYDELADKLCICRRYAEQVVRHLIANGCNLRYKVVGRTKYFWAPSSISLLPTVLTNSEKLALEAAMNAPNKDLQTAVYKITQLAQIQLSIRAQA